MLMIAMQSSVVREEEEEQDDAHCLTFKQRLTPLAGRQRRDRRLPRAALLDPSRDAQDLMHTY